MIKITFNEAKFRNYKNIQFKLTEDGIEYYRPEQPIYVVRWWLNEYEFAEREFKTLKSAIKFITKNHYTADINYYLDIADRYWKKQYQYTKGILLGEEEQ